MRRRGRIAGWELYGPGVFKSQHLDEDGFHNLIAVGADYRVIQTARVFGPEDQREVVRMLRRMLAERFPNRE
ncbi:MAG: hypothetical protein ACREM1_06680 [Longimicrobiales bacterium]